MIGLDITTTGDSVTAGDGVLFGEDAELCAIANCEILAVAVAPIRATVIFLILIFIYIWITSIDANRAIDAATPHIFYRKRFITNQIPL